MTVFKKYMFDVGVLIELLHLFYMLKCKYPGSKRAGS